MAQTFGVVVCVIGFAVGVYTYERYHRGPSETAFFGTWKKASTDPEDSYYLRLSADQTFDMSVSPGFDNELVFLWGRWYAGGPNFYLRFNADAWRGPTRPQVWRIEDIAHDRFSIRSGPSVETYDRVK